MYSSYRVLFKKEKNSSIEVWISWIMCIISLLTTFLSIISRWVSDEEENHWSSVSHLVYYFNGCLKVPVNWYAIHIGQLTTKAQ